MARSQDRLKYDLVQRLDTISITYKTDGLSNDPLTGELRVKWQKTSAYYFVCEGLDFEIELNIKGGYPCLHFRYSRPRLHIGDSICFHYGRMPFIVFTIEGTPHRFNDKLYEVDIPITEDDLSKLTSENFVELSFRFAGSLENTVPSRIFYGQSSWNAFKRLDANEKLNKFSAVQIFKLYVEEYKKSITNLDKNTTGGQSNPLQSNPQGNSREESCYVYLMHDANTNFYKIGISKDPDYRERTLQSQKPVIEMITAKKFPNRKIAEAIEKALHKVFDEQRIRGEWFRLNNNEVEQVKETLS